MSSANYCCVQRLIDDGGKFERCVESGSSPCPDSTLLFPPPPMAFGAPLEPQLASTAFARLSSLHPIPLSTSFHPFLPFPSACPSLLSHPVISAKPHSLSHSISPSCSS